MLPIFLLEETTVRESGESAVFDANQHSHQDLLLTFAITHAVEHESIDVSIYGSRDGISWETKPIASFAPKYYCGNYQLLLQPSEARYLKATWRLQRWSRGEQRPFFRLYIFLEPSRVRVATAGAA
jgi:hypothetical protein